LIQTILNQNLYIRAGRRVAGHGVRCGYRWYVQTPLELWPRTADYLLSTACGPLL